MLSESVLVAVLILWGALLPAAYGQKLDDSTQEPPYRLKVSVDEVNIVFHASDASGRPVNDLKLEEIDLFDNGHGPGRILALDSLRGGTLRLAVLVDTSGSVTGGLARTRKLAAQVFETLLRKETDFGLLVEFGRSRNTLQPWTKDVGLLARSGGRIAPNPAQGTSLYDAIFGTCFHDLGKEENKGGRNALVVFTDGVDNGSYVTLQAAADICQQANTAIYAFDTAECGAADSGAQNLRELLRQTGGRFFSLETSDSEILGKLQSINGDLFDGYRLIYRPNELKRDGSFHQIVLVGPERVSSIAAASGFYAPKH